MGPRTWAAGGAVLAAAPGEAGGRVPGRSAGAWLLGAPDAGGRAHAGPACGRRSVRANTLQTHKKYWNINQ